MVGISQGHTPARPTFRAIDDRHWAFIERCWLSVQERPSTKEIVISIEQFLSCYPQLPRKTTSDASSLGGLGDGTNDEEVFGREENAIFRNNPAQGILERPGPSASGRQRLRFGRDTALGEAEVSLKIYFIVLCATCNCLRSRHKQRRSQPSSILIVTSTSLHSSPPPPRHQEKRKEAVV